MSSEHRSQMIALGAILAFLGVALGAFGAHALAERLSADDGKMLEVWKTAVLYHLIHAVAIVAVSGIASRAVMLCFAVGIILFSGSLYAMALSGIRGLGAITPIGGLAFLAGWLMLAVSAFQRS